MTELAHFDIVGSFKTEELKQAEINLITEIFRKLN